MFSYLEQTIPGGDDGTRETLRTMARLVRTDVVHPLVRDVAVAIARSSDPGNGVALAEGVRRWVERTFRFVHDPPDRELLHSPEAQLRQFNEVGYISGDCDDAAILAACIGMAAGCPARFVAVAFLDKAAAYAHVWAEVAPPTGPGGEWIECDVTRRFQSVPTALISRVLVYPIA